MTKLILADGRWIGNHGIGRFAKEVLARLTPIQLLPDNIKPLSLGNIFWQPYQIQKNKNLAKAFFTPGFNAPIYSALPFVFTLHDLIHLRVPAESQFKQRFYYQAIVKPALKRAHKILTVSEYSKQDILEWSGIAPEKIVVVGNGISAEFKAQGEKYQPGFPYLFYVGNLKPHKNIPRLLSAFATAKIPEDIRLIMTGQATATIMELLTKLNIAERVIFTGMLDDSSLAKYYRGALALIFPSLYEGFGLPALEAMACGTPIVAAQATSLPEIISDAAVYVDPQQIDSIATGITTMVNSAELRTVLAEKGLTRARDFSWDKTAAKIQLVLDEIN